MEYKRTTSEDDPRGLFQEQIPLSFLELQKAIKKEVTSRSVTGSPPVMMEEEFKYGGLVYVCVCNWQCVEPCIRMLVPCNS